MRIKEITDIEAEERNNYKFTEPILDAKYIKTLNLSSVNAKELDFIKRHMSLVFADILPYTAKNGVIISKWCFAYPLTTQKGLIYIDNGYKGCMQNRMDYTLAFKFHPSYSNEHKYFAHVNIDSISEKSLEKLAIEIEKSLKRFCQL